MTATVGSDPATRRAGLPRWAIALLAVSGCFALLGIGVAAVAVLGDGGGDPLAGIVTTSDDGPAPLVDAATRAVTFVVPAGTAKRQAAGEKVVVLPTRVGIKVGQTLHLRNDDDKAVVIGPFFVGPHETSTYRFSSPRVIVGACDLHPSGEFALEVTA